MEPLVLSMEQPLSQQLSSISDSDSAESDVESMSTVDLLYGFLNLNEDITLATKGYEKKRKICDCSQGTIIEAEKSESGINNKYIIKKVDKTLYKEKITLVDEDSIVVQEDIVKEALILHHLTVSNKPIANYIASFIEFFEDDNYYYLVREFGGNCTLKEFNKIAHQHLSDGRLNRKEWKKIIKFLFWQLCSLMYWLHHDMNCAHLDLKLENIVIENGHFIENDDGKTVTIDPDISIKLIDFGLSEIFNDDGALCNKFCFGNHSQYSSPQLFDEEIYDAKSDDIWCLGMILYELVLGEKPYHYQNEKDKAFWSLQNGHLSMYLQMNNLKRYIPSKMLSLINGMLCFDEKNRFKASNVIQCSWFASYYKRYQETIDKKSKSQQKNLNTSFQQTKMQHFPYFTL